MKGEFRMIRPRSAGRVVVGLVAVLAALALVAWRQSEARETMAELEDVVRELAVAGDEMEELVRVLARVEGRAWVAAEARRRLGLRPPGDGEVVIPSGGAW